MKAREIVVDSRGEAHATWIGIFMSYAGLERIMVADSQGEVRESPLVNLEEDAFPNGVVICPQEDGVMLMDPALSTTESRALRERDAYYMDLVGRIMEITTGQYVTGRRDTFGFHADILEGYAVAQGVQTAQEAVTA